LLDGADVAATDWVETSSDITNRALAIFKGVSSLTCEEINFAVNG
jgi:hypothetical protein